MTVFTTITTSTITTIAATIARTLTCALLLSASAWAQTPTSPQIVHESPSAFNDGVFVVDEGELRSMRFGSASGDKQSEIRLGHPEQLPMPYLRTAAIGLAVPKKLENVLMVGLGGGAFASFLRVRLPDAGVDAVEIDPVVANIAYDYFALPKHEQLRVHVMDATEFVRDSREKYDYILLDAYDAEDIPEALITSRFLGGIRALVAEGGIVVANIAIGSQGKTREVIYKLSYHFTHCLHMQSTPRYNDVLLLSMNPLPERAALVQLARQFDEQSTADLALTRHAETARVCSR